MSLCGKDERTNDEQVKIELLSQWKLEAEFRNYENENDDDLPSRRRAKRDTISWQVC